MQKQIIRRFVKETLSNQSDASSDLEAYFVTGQRIPYKIIRLLWIAIGFICFAICCYQIYDRIDWYILTPVVVDVKTTEDPTSMPPFRMSGVDTDLMRSYWELVPRTDGIIKYFCSNILLIPFRSPEFGVINYTEFWKASDIAPNIRQVGIQHKGKVLANIFYENGKITNSSNAQIVRLSKRNTIMGYATIFNISVSVLPGTIYSVTFHHSGFCPISGIMLAVENVLPFYYVAVLDFGYTVDLTYSMQIYNFLNTATSPCEENEDIVKRCFRNCLIKHYRQLDCWLPFMPEEAKVVDCSTLINYATVRRVHSQAYRILSSLSPTFDCSCPRTCFQQKSKFEVKQNPGVDGDKEFTIHYQRKDIPTTQTSERGAYDFIHLLVDVGGSLGLFLGLCVLSILKLLQSTSGRLIKDSVTNRTRMSTICKLCVKKELSVILQSKSKNRSVQNWTIVLQHLLLCILTIIAIYLMTIQIQFYFTDPIHSTVILTEKSTVAMPSIIICGEGQRITKLKQKFADENNIDECKVRLLDLLDLKMSLPIATLWEYQKLNIVTNSSDNSTELQLDAGTCHNFSSSESSISSHCKRNCLLVTQIVSLEPKSFVGVGDTTDISVEGLISNCTKNPYLLQVFVHPAEYSKYSVVFSKIAVMPGTLNGFAVETTFAVRYNSTKRPCVSRNHFENCKSACQERQMQELIKCRLPFLTSYQPPCTTAKTAKEAYLIYIAIILHSDNLRNCRCERPCSENNNKIHWSLEGQHDNPDKLEIYAYPYLPI